MSITIQNLRIIPYGQKDVIKPVFGDTMSLTFALPDHEAGDKYTLALDYERILLPTMRPLCAMATEYTAAGTDISFALEINTERFALWVSALKKPTPIWLQLQRERGGVYTTLLLDDILALPSVVDGANMVFPGTPLEDALKKKLDKPADAGQVGDVLKLGENGETVWGTGGGGGSQQATDAEIDARQSQTHAITPNNLEYAARSVLDNITLIPAATTAYSLLDASATTNNHSWQYFHTPEAASTYVFPAVTDDSVAHRIKLTIDFTAVQTYSFEDFQGAAITPLFTPTISAGDVYEFECEYSAVKSQWLVWPHKQGAVSDDYVMQSQVGVANGVAGLDGNGKVPDSQLQVATTVKKGIANVSPDYGTSTLGSGTVAVIRAEPSDIDARQQKYKPIVPYNLNYAVTAALTDAHKIQLTDSQKTSAQDTLGAAPAPVVFTTAGDAPTTSTVGTPGRRAVNTADGKAWTCTAKTNTGTEEEPVWSYTWVDDINAMGGVFAANKMIKFSGNAGGIEFGYGRMMFGASAVAAGYNCFAVGVNATADNGILADSVIAIGTGSKVMRGGTIAIGRYNYTTEGVIAVFGNGLSNAARSDIARILPAGVEVNGFVSQRIQAIPDATSEFTLSEGTFSHSPSTATTYVLPAVAMALDVGGMYLERRASLDGDGYYGWLSGTTNRYTASATPAVGDNTYTNTALTQGAKAITAIDERTHECILTVRFSSSVLTYAFEDSAGNPITPLPLAGTIADGSVVAFRCTWEALLNQWVIEPKLLNPNA